MEQVVENNLIKTPDSQLDAELAEMLAEIEGEELSEDDVEEILASSDEDIEAAVAEVEMAEAKAQVYEEQEAEEEKPAIATRDPSTPKQKVVKTSTKVNTTGMKTSEAIQAVLGTDWKSFMALDLGDLDDNGEVKQEVVDYRLKEFDGLAKKQGAKAVNVFKWVAKGVRLEAYVDQAMKTLIADGEMSSDGLRKKYLAHPYSAGTANSQTSQIMNVLPALGVAHRSARGLLTLNPASTLVQHYKTVNNIS